ncbi:hypothetical protein SBA3_960036 [Candidatus Sulfopaludibacter sp. SbA3]|nr:hypothetical protein SBA3_960036 [Candidatus Sulfopaludibacter sp. SbA3]
MKRGPEEQGSGAGGRGPGIGCASRVILNKDRRKATLSLVCDSRENLVTPAVLPPVKLAIRPSHTPFNPTQSVALLAPGPWPPAPVLPARGPCL